MELRESELNISSVDEVKPTSGSTKKSKVNETKNQTNTKNKIIIVDTNSKKLIRLYFIGKNDIKNVSKKQVNSNVLENKALKTNTTEIMLLNKQDKANDQLNNIPNKVRVLDKKKIPLLHQSDDFGETEKIETGNFVNIFFK